MNFRRTFVCLCSLLAILPGKAFAEPGAGERISVARPGDAFDPALRGWTLAEFDEREEHEAFLQREAVVITRDRTGVEQGAASDETDADVVSGIGDTPAGLAGATDDCDEICQQTRARRSPSDHAVRADGRYRGFFTQAGSIPTELAIVAGYYAVSGGTKFFEDTRAFHFHDEGWFGKDTINAGVDKMAHMYNTYLLAEILHARIHRNTDGASGDALTAAVLAFGFTAINEVSDAVEPDSGYSMQDVAMNAAGAAFSVLRNTVPGLKEKLSYKIEIVPNSDGYTFAGKSHWSQMRFMFSLKGAGFAKLHDTPLHYLDLQVGYWASDILNWQRDAGIEPKRHLFVGVGLNLGELLFGRAHGPVGTAARTVLDYVQVPYTSLRYDTTGRLGSSGAPR